MEIEQLEKFVNWMTVRGLSGYTIFEYLFYLKKVPADKIFDTKHMNEWLYTSGMKKGGVIMTCNALRNYYKFSHRKELGKKLDVPKEKYRGSIYYLDIEEVDRMINACRREKDIIAIRMLFETGLRISTLLEIKVSDIDLEKKRIIIEPKMPGNKGKLKFIVFFIEETKRLIANYIKKLHLKPDDKIIDYKYITIYKRIKKIAKDAGLPSWVSPHKLRHSFATHFYQKTKHAKALQELLGHRDSRMSNIYVHIGDKEKAEEFRKAFG